VDGSNIAAPAIVPAQMRPRLSTIDAPLKHSRLGKPFSVLKV
jgi:hypothetical protein